MKRGALVVALASAVALALGAASCGSQPACSPEKAGFSSSEAVTQRSLPSRSPDQGPCNPHLTLVHDAAGLAQAYADLSVEEEAGVAPPAVDFTRETVVVREADLTQGISWVAVRGSVVTLGLQGCLQPPDENCQTTIFAVPAVVATVDTRSCDPVACGFSPTPN